MLTRNHSLPSNREVRWERMFPDQLEQAFSICPVVYFTYGLCEPHGPQNTLGLDALKAHAIACLAAQKYGGIVAPLNYWHIHELGGYAIWSHNYIGQVPRTWLTSVPPWVHFKNVLYQIRQADAIGFHAAILFTGHYGPNWEDLKTLVKLVQPYVGVRLYGLPEFEANQPGFESKMINISKPYIGEEEKQAVLEVLASGMLVQGPRTAALEAKFTRVCDVKHAIATSSGTTA